MGGLAGDALLEQRLRELDDAPRIDGPSFLKGLLERGGGRVVTDPDEIDRYAWSIVAEAREEERERYRPLVEAVRLAEGEVDAVAGDDLLDAIWRALHDLKEIE